MKMLGSNTDKFTINIKGAPITPSVACPPHTSLDDLKAARQAQQREQQAAAKRLFGAKTPAENVVKKVEPKPKDATSLTDKLAADGDVRRTRKRSTTAKPRAKGTKR